MLPRRQKDDADGVAAARVVWRALAVAALPLPPLYWATDLQLDGIELTAYLSCCAALAGLGRLYRRRDALVATAAVAAAQALLLMLWGGLLQYPLARLGRQVAFRDASLAAWDARLGFDGMAYLHGTAAHPWLMRLLGTAYDAWVLQLVVVLLVLACTRQRARLFQVVLAIGVAGALTSLIFFFVPAQGVFVADPVGLHLGSAVGQPNWFVTLTRLRGEAPMRLSLRHSEGLVCFPSFHTVGSLLFAWATWPVAWLRWPMAWVSLLVVLATPIFGEHYLIDLLAGALVAAWSLWAARRLLGAAFLESPSRDGL